MNGKREYGDYQTPEHFAMDVCRFLKNIRGVKPKIIIEPTCGIGNFLKSSQIFGASEIIGIEVNPKYCEICKDSISASNVHIINANFFSFDFTSTFAQKEDVLIIGNPPWVNNSTLSSLNSDNLPIKVNFKDLKGIEAITGSSNFDICEYIILQLISSMNRTNTTIAMLCKTSVARNIFFEMKRTHINFNSCDIYEFDANKIFRINVSTCLLVIELSKNNVLCDVCRVYSLEKPLEKKNSFSYIDGNFYSNTMKNVDDFSGECCFEWRQGIKHDCSKVMELTVKENILVNGMKEIVDIESDYVFPLIKSSMFKSPIINKFNKYVIVTQKKIKEDTFHIKVDAPKTWTYLKSHMEFFSRRKSIIYKNTPNFSMFGIGNYSYAPYKVGVSGFYKKPFFSVLVSQKGKPVMTDDTSYFICFSTYDMAYTAMIILNSKRVQKFLLTIAFMDAKRPFTKKVLKRIDFKKIVNNISLDELNKTEKELNLKKFLNKGMWQKFKLLIESK